MNFLELKNKCRICLKDNADIHWDNVLNDYSNQTYKDCYYKYTQLECLDDDNFSELLCHNCSDGLEFVDTFILKALDSHLVLDNYRLSMAIKDEINIIDDGATKFEDIFIEETEPKIESLSIYENTNEELTTITENTKTSKISKISTEKKQKQKKESVESKITINKIEELNNFEDECTGQEIIVNDLKIEIMEETSHLEANKKSRKGGPMCCSICSKVFRNKYLTIKHEKTHNELRERKSCNICGLKVINKTILKSHMQTHSKDRERPHKCEYCDKAFYYKGGLNIHRRLHLGEMVSCVICTKEFYRQIDLDRHMYTHSAGRINSNAKQKDKCYFHCKDCGKNVRTNNFNSHIAEHKNEPLFKCSICNKEFFRRTSSLRHLKRVHKKTTEEFKNFIIAYKQDRRSRLYLKQNAELQFCTD